MHIFLFFYKKNPIHLSMDSWVASLLGLLWIFLLWTWGYKYLFKTLLSTLLGIYPKVELLDHINSVFGFFEEPSRCFPQQLHHFIFHHQYTGLQFLHILANTCCFFDSGHPNGWVVYSCFYRWETWTKDIRMLDLEYLTQVPIFCCLHCIILITYNFTFNTFT